jgi:hypothetical protein
MTGSHNEKRMIFSIASVLPQIITTILFFIFIRVVDKDVASSYIKYEAAIYFLSGFFCLGLDKLIERKYINCRHVFKNSLAFQATIFIASFCILYVFYQNYLMYSIGIYSSVTFFMFSSYFLVKGDAVYYLATKTARALLVGLLPLFAFALYQDAVQIFNFRIVLEFVFIFGLVFLMVLKNKKNGIAGFKILGWKDLSYGLPFILTTGSSLVYVHLDKLLLEPQMHVDVFINYVAMQKIYLIFIMGLSALFVRMPVYVFSKGESYSFSDQYRVVLYLTSFLGVSVLVFHEYLNLFISLPDFINFSLVFIILQCGVLSIIVSFVTSTRILLRNKSILNMISAIFGAFIYLVQFYIFELETLFSIFAVWYISYLFVFLFQGFFLFRWKDVFLSLIGLYILSVVATLLISTILLNFEFLFRFILVSVFVLFFGKTIFEKMVWMRWR